MWRSSAVAAITEVPPLTWGTYKGRRQYVYRMIYVKTAAPELENLDIQRELERLVNIKNIKNAKNTTQFISTMQAVYSITVHSSRKNLTSSPSSRARVADAWAWSEASAARLAATRDNQAGNPQPSLTASAFAA